MSLHLPSKLTEKAAGFPESSYGTTKVILVLKDGRKIFGVSLAWGTEILSIDGQAVMTKKDLDFGMSDIVDVIPGP
jgi:hypothetical protein